MNDDAFARRFYADRAELESLGIDLKVDKPADGSYEAESYTLPPENFYLPAIEFSDAELGALRMALSLLDGEFAYAEPLRLALQQLSWGKPSPVGAADNQPVALAQTAEAGGRELSQRLSKIETAIFRRKTIVFDYYTIGRDAEEKRKVDPYQLLYQRGQFYLIGYSHERQDIRVFRLSRIRGKVSYSSKAEHDFARPGGLRPPLVRHPHGLAARRVRGHRAHLAFAARRLADRAPLRTRRHDPARRGGRRRARPTAPCSRPSTPTRARSSHGCSSSATGRACWARPSSSKLGAERLELVVERHTRHVRHRQAEGAPVRAAGARSRTTARATRRSGPSASPARHAREHPDQGCARGREARARSAVRGAERDRAGAAGGHRRPERRQLRRRQLRRVRRGRGRHDRGGPRALRRQLRPPRAPPSASGEGARRCDRPDRRAHPEGIARVRAQEDHRRARAGSRRRTGSRSRARRATTRTSRACSARASSRTDWWRSTTTRRTRTTSRRAGSSRTSSPTAARAGTSSRSTSSATTRARSGWTGSAPPPCSTRSSSRARASRPTRAAG